MTEPDNEWQDGPLTEDAAPEWLDELDADAPPPEVRPRPREVRVDDRPEVQMGKDLHRVVDEIAEALASDPVVYHRSHELVTVVGATAGEGAPVARGSPVIRPLVPAAAMLRLTRRVKLVAYVEPSAKAIAKAEILGKKPQGEMKEILVPPVVMGGLLAAGDWPGIRPLVGVSETPFLRPDGSVCQERGYDAATGFLLAPSVDYPPISDAPTQDEARAALVELVDVFREFPHVSDAARMVPIAAILTILARPAIQGAVPAFVFDASTRGSGKTLQAHVVSLICFGRFASPCTFPKEDDELEKILSSYAIAGSPIILLENITHPFGGAPLDKALTARGSVEFRMLGRSELRRLAWIALVLASGNNVTLPEDTVRRVLVSRIESELENPEDRVGVRDLPHLCRQCRPKLIKAGLTVLRAYAAHGYPDAGPKPWGSFEEWSRLIPHAIIFAGGPNVLDARPRGDTAGDELGALATVLRELPRLSATPLTAKSLVTLLWPSDREDNAPPDQWDDLREAIEALAPPRYGRAPTPKAVGERFRRAQGRVLSGGTCLTSSQGHAGVRMWSVLRRV